MWISVTSATTGKRLLINAANVGSASEAPDGSALYFGPNDSILIRESLSDLASLLGAKQAPIRPEVSGE